jgi:hypothetical protein
MESAVHTQNPLARSVASVGVREFDLSELADSTLMRFHSSQKLRLNATESPGGVRAFYLQGLVELKEDSRP